LELFTVADLFVVGVVLDLMGAYLLSLGLLASHSTLALRTGTYFDSNPHMAVGLAEDRIDGRFGVVYLVLGFSVQAVSYVLELGFDTSTDPSASRALAALALAVVVGVSAYAVWKRKRPRQKQTLVEMAHYDTSPAFEPPVRRDGPDLGLLFAWGRAAGYPTGDEDSERRYAERVFGVTNGSPDSPGG
jgi:hypothetical protein